MLTKSDVAAAYLLLLEREPESEEAIYHWIAKCKTKGQLVREIIGSPEFVNCSCGLGYGFPNGRSHFPARLGQLNDLVTEGFVKFDYEALLERRYRRWISEGDSVIDVGAHAGRHLQPLLECIGSGGQALAFEPIPEKYELLSRRFSGAPVRIHRVALSDYSGQAEFTLARGTPEESGLKQRVYNRPTLADPVSIFVNVECLDSYASMLDRLSFIKIDTEGGEIGCLRGAPNTLERHRPVVSVEYGIRSYSAYGHDVDTLFDLAAEKGYVLYDIFLNSLQDRDDWHAACNSIYWDFFMVPSERQAEFVGRVRSAT